MTTTIKTQALDLAYDEDTAEEAAARIAEQFEISVDIVNQQGPASGWPEVVLSGWPSRVREALEEAWLSEPEPGYVEPYTLQLDLECPLPTCDGRLEVNEAYPTWGTCSVCALDVDLDAYLERIEEGAELDDLAPEPEFPDADLVAEAGLDPSLRSRPAGSGPLGEYTWRDLALKLLDDKRNGY